MTEEVTKPVTGTVGYEYKVPNGQYEYGYAVGSIYIPFAADPEGMSPEEVHDEAAATLVAAKELVYQALGVEYEMTYSDNGVADAVALIKEAFGDGVVVERTESKFKRKPRPAQAAAQPSKVTVDKQLEGHPLPGWLDAEWQFQVDRGRIEADDNQLWDNRKFLTSFGGKQKDTGPWFRTKNAKVGIAFGGRPDHLKEAA